jgi:hypothetical protein
MKKILMLVMISQFFFTSACTTWRNPHIMGAGNPSEYTVEYIELEKPDKVRATVLGGEQFELIQPTLAGDALVSSDGVSVELDEIIALEVRKTSIGHSIGAFFLGAVGAGLGLQGIYCLSSPDDC